MKRKLSRTEKILIGCVILVLLMILLNWSNFVTGIKNDSLKLFDKDTVQTEKQN
ncbi:MAG: hypothetical protein N4A72_07520 [Bacteroidales bacterium]|jgi:hypothetical protein|nr:hypothetical protein [Bacteroidales bacterium]